MKSHALDLESLTSQLAAVGGPCLVHHFATWCEPCEEELPHLGAVLAAAPPALRRIAVSWDLFLAPVAPDDALAACARFLERNGVAPDRGFDTLIVYTGAPEALMEAQEIGEGTVPFTEVRDVTGRRIASWSRPLVTAGDHRELADAIARVGLP